ncbi:MAG: cation-translocating P-type ATPase, partial [Oscillospiraceae bacterium]|nr:cation-translocating P-type ATPase [Oscillospiraceae bacterium]
GADSDLVAIASALCSDAEVNRDEDQEVVGEPTEAALVAFALSKGFNKNDLKEKNPRVAEAPFDSGRKMMSTVHKTENGIVQYTKGAPDEILRRCTKILTESGIAQLTDAHREAILNANKAMADKALRVLAVTEKFHDDVPADASPEALENDLIFIGLTGMIDPVRPEVKAAIAECREAGITPIMITGDHYDTAVAIAKELGIATDSSQAITGAELSAMSDEEFSERVKEIYVYARVQPEHKTRIVNAWHDLGMVTAMTGDGVNDAPSIKSADIGVGMGITGTDVTKNVADMVLADDNFATIVAAVAEGRRIYDNIKKAIQFLLSSNLSEVFAIFFSTLCGFTILKPTHLLFINLITDSLPALALGVEPPEKDIMNRKPRKTNEGVFANGMGFDVVYQGLLVSVLTVISYFIGRALDPHVVEEAGMLMSGHGITMAFLTLSMCEIFHSFNMRSQRKSIFSLGKKQNMLLLGAMLLSFVLTTAIIEIPVLAKLFDFTTIGILEYAISIGLALMVIPVVEIVKAIQRKLEK